MGDTRMQLEIANITNPKQLSPLVMAYIGDAVYELMVRTWLCLHGKATNKGLHKAAITYVSAPAQAQRCQKILPILTEEEQDVIRRGRNSHTAAVPKGASVGEYHTATALEALGVSEKLDGTSFYRDIAL